MSHTFDYQQVVEDVRTTLQNAFGPNSAIRTEEGWHGRVHVKIVSNAFDGMSEEEKQEIIWTELRNRLGAEAQAVSLVLAYGLDEI
jgi:acid stress-induced BolA-like protein IbaG/YrbA